MLPRLLSFVIPVNTDTDWEAELRCNDCKLVEIIAMLLDTKLNGLQKQVTVKMLLTVPSSHCFEIEIHPNILSLWSFVIKQRMTKIIFSLQLQIFVSPLSFLALSHP